MDFFVAIKVWKNQVMTHHEENVSDIMIIYDPLNGCESTVFIPFQAIGYGSHMVHLMISQENLSRNLQISIKIYAQ